MFKRTITTELQKLTSYPVITLIGPRQSGKTTLVQFAFPQKPYLSLEDPDIRRAATEDPRGFLQSYPEGAILDEIQRAPLLLSYIQGIVDKKQKGEMFILTGSHQLELHQAISQSLAGRTALLTLLPMSIAELTEAGFHFDVDGYLLHGGYPRIFKDSLDPTTAYRNYFQTYVERDVRQLIHIKDLNQFEKFVRLCAGRVGQILNQEEIGGEVGISSHTVKEWLSLLEASFIIFRLQPYFENFGKRLIKSPKIFFTDVGLATYLLGISETMQLQRDPLRGHLFENLVVLELLKARANQGLDPNLYYYRDVKKNEIDLLYKQGHNLYPIEIKSSKTFHPDFVKPLRFFQEVAEGRAPKNFLIYGGDSLSQFQGTTLLNFKEAAAVFSQVAE